MIGARVAGKALTDAFDALNCHNLKKFMSAWRDDGVFVYPGEIRESGKFQGKDAVEGWFRHSSSSFQKSISKFKTSASGISLISSATM